MVFFYKMLLASAPINEVMTTSPHASRPDRSTRDTDSIALYRFLAPRFWPIWLGLGLVRAVNVLPLPAQLAVGRALGRLAYRFARRDRRIASINIAPYDGHKRGAFPVIGDAVRLTFDSSALHLFGEDGRAWHAG